MKFLMDTNVLIALMKRNTSLLAKMRMYTPSDFGLSTIVLFEMQYGAERSQRKEENLAKLELLPFEKLPFTAEDARIAGTIKAFLYNQRTPIGAYDIQIAAQALSRRLILLTYNTKEFLRVPNLEVADWISE